MNLAVGAKLGPYEILGSLGSGGMGDVLRARDARLGRDVAVKVLPASVAENQERLRRFEREARAAGVLNHPNLLAVYDVGTHDGQPYIVSELLEGDTLRALLRGGPLPLRKAVEYGAQICRGLAAAHDKGIVHRDLKPENVLVTRDGRVKILDFGLAKPVAGSPMLHEDATTGNLGTSPGVVLGTVGYLSPEQVRGLPVDHRSDIFSFGAVFYETLTSRRAFKRENPVETMAAILRDEPPPITEADGVTPVLALILRRCLEKTPEQRFQSAQDLAFDLESMVTHSGRAPVLPLEPVRRRSRALGRLAAAAALLAAGAVVGHFIWKTPAPPPPTFKQLTFRRGYVGSARFAPDGHTILYSASWQGEPMEVFSTRPEGPESRSLGYKQAELLAVSSTGEMALALERRRRAGFAWTGTLARVPFGGGAPREIMAGVEWADWSPDGTQLAVVRSQSAKSSLEFPPGTVIHQTSGWIASPRVSPRGDAIAFIEHPASPDTSGMLMLVEVAQRQAVRLSAGWTELDGVAWRGDEIWFAGARTGSHPALLAISRRGGAPRLLGRIAAGLSLEDVSADGRALVAHGSVRGGMLVLAPGESRERDLSWLDWSVASDLSADGRFVLFHEPAEGGGPASYVYLARTDGSPAVRLGEGVSGGLSPDGRFAIAVREEPSHELVLLPTGAGEPKTIALAGVLFSHARWSPDGRTVVVLGAASQEGPRLYAVDIEQGTPPRPITPEGVDPKRFSISGDGRRIALADPERGITVYGLNGGGPVWVAGSEPRDWPVQWSADGRSIYVVRKEEDSSEILRLDLLTAQRRPWKRLRPADPAGVLTIGSELVTSDGKSYAYSYVRALTDLYLVEGLLTGSSGAP